ncbi:MAG: Mur ligase family protein [Patescibacteria group bacterium]
MKRIHFIGICGVAMGALAIAFKENGWAVSGSDVGFYPPISTHLKNHGIYFYPGWHPEKMMKYGAPDIVVVGNVAGSTNPEFLCARENRLKYKSYPEVIAEHIVQKNSIVCAGTYGKTSSSSLLTWILTKSDMDPTYMFGGISLNMRFSAKIKDENKNPEWSVLEGDEYKTARWDNSPKFDHYSPTHLLLTSVSWDHADVYPTEESYFQAFAGLANKIPENGIVVACVDGKNVEKILDRAGAKAKIIKYGKKDGDYIFNEVNQSKTGISFVINNGGVKYKISSSVLGEHMAENICGAFAMAKEIGIETKIITEAISNFRGIKRRLEKRYEGKITVYDDLAHSPAKAKATLKTLRSIYPKNKIFAIFEPNTGNRTLQSIPGYAKAFMDADEILIPTLTKLKNNPEEEHFDGEKLAEVIRENSRQTKYIPNDAELVNYVKENSKIGDVAVFLGSHGFRGMIEDLVAHSYVRIADHA